MPRDTPASRGGAALPGMSYTRGCFLRITEPAVKHSTSSALGSQAAKQQIQRLYRHCLPGPRVEWTLRQELTCPRLAWLCPSPPIPPSAWSASSPSPLP